MGKNEYDTDTKRKKLYILLVVVVMIKEQKRMTFKNILVRVVRV